MAIDNLERFQAGLTRVGLKRVEEQRHTSLGRTFSTWRNGDCWFAQVDGDDECGVGLDRDSVREMAEQHIAEDPDDEDDGSDPCDRDRCERCGGVGHIEYDEAGPDVWGEDCPSEVNHLVECPDCGGTRQGA